MRYNTLRWIARALAIVLAAGLYCKANAQGGMGPGPGTVHSSGGGGGGFSLVDHAVATGFPNPVTTSAIDTTNSTQIIVGLAQNNSFAIGTINDFYSNTWNARTAQSQASGPYVRLFDCALPCTVGPNHTFTASNGGAFISASVYVQAWKGGTGTFDVQNGTTTGFGNTAQPGSVTPSVNNSLLVTIATADNTSTLFTIGSGFVTSDTVNSGAYGSGMAYFVQGTAAAINPTWSWTNSGGADFATAIATYKP